MDNQYNTIEEALEDLRAGKLYLLPMTKTGKTKVT